MAVPFPIPPLLLAIMGGAFLFVLAGFSIVPPLATGVRQAGYEQVVRRELVRLEVILPATAQVDADATAELIRALHPGQRRGVGRFRVGWPPIELRLLWRDGALHWQIDCPAQVVASVEMAVHSVLGRCELEEVPIDDLVPSAVATARLARAATRSLRPDVTSASSVPLRLAVALDQARASAEVVLRIRLMPGAIAESDEEGIGRSIGGFLVSTIVDALLMRSVADKPMPAATTHSTEPATGMYSATIALKASGPKPAVAAALLWKLVVATDALRSGPQSLAWTVREGSKSGSSALSADPELLGALWALPDRRFDALGLERERSLPGSRRESASGIAIAEARRGPLVLSTDTLARHLAVFGATGSGKTTLLLNLVLGCARSGVGVSVIDPHGDLTADILGRLPQGGGPAVHVLRLADRAHPRGFNFLERHGSDDAQLVASEFVTLLADLWPRFCGPKMQHYLRHALFAAFADRDQQTILELIRILTNDAARVRYTDQLSDPMERAFWRDEWPGPRERERDPSIKAVLNKLGAFVSYGSIRSVVGQGDSTISPRMVMDSGDILVVDLSGVGGDNSALFGAMLISRFAIDAVGRQGRPATERRPHLLVVDEAQRFHTQALEGILAEGRKFGLHAALAAQSLSALGERLGSAVRTNVASVALLEPGPEDVRDLGRLFAPVAPEELLAMRRFDVVVRTRGSDGTPLVRGGRVSMPGPADPERLAANVAASDERDAPRSLKDVEDEVHRRSGGNEPPEEDKPAAPETAATKRPETPQRTSDNRPATDKT